MTLDLQHSAQWPSLREKIFAAPWHQWAHAYGPADDVPSQLEALAVGSEEERKKACSQLYGNVFHQGTRWHASPRTVPFLLELLALSQPPIPDRPWLIEYLIALALGYDGEFLPRGIDPDKYFADVEAQDDEIGEDGPYDEEHLQGPEFARYTTFARDTYRAVERGCDLFLHLLDDAELPTRLAAAYALGWFPSRAADVSRALLERWDAMGEAEQANALLALSLQGLWISADELARWASRAEAMLDLGSVAGRFGAAMALANWSSAAGQSWDERALQVLASVVTSDELGQWQNQQYEAGAALSWNSGNLQSLTAARLADVPESGRARSIEALTKAVESASPMTSLELTNTLLLLAFPLDEDGERAPIERASLSSQQKAAVEAVAEFGAWRVRESSFANYSSLVRGFGLPGSADELRAWLGQ